MFKDAVIHTDLECPLVQVILGHERGCGIRIKKCSFEEEGFAVLNIMYQNKHRLQVQASISSSQASWIRGPPS